MQTNFSLTALADATCKRVRKNPPCLRALWLLYCDMPTYLLLGDEADSPRGRIYLIKDMLERGKPATLRSSSISIDV